MGPNRLTLRSDGSFGLAVKVYPYDIHRGAPRTRKDLVLSATLTFKPTFSGVQHVRPFRPPGVDGATHTWVLAAPHGVMSGRAQLIGQGDSAGLVDLPIETLAYHDHNYGQGALAEAVAGGTRSAGALGTGSADLAGGGGIGVKRLARGHFLGPNYAVAWQRCLLQGLPGARSDAVLLFERDRDPMVIEAPTIVTEHMRTTRWLVKYPGRATLHGSDAKGNSVELVIEHTRLVERSPFHVRLEAKACLTLAGRQRYAGVGQTTVLQFQRLRWPLLSDMVLMSLRNVESDDPLWRQ
ncbi:MAG: hypothetical protein WCI73_07940 [Phycisphaerae bacterium]